MQQHLVGMEDTLTPILVFVLRANAVLQGHVGNSDNYDTGRFKRFAVVTFTIALQLHLAAANRAAPSVPDAACACGSCRVPFPAVGIVVAQGVSPRGFHTSKVVDRQLYPVLYSLPGPMTAKAAAPITYDATGPV